MSSTDERAQVWYILSDFWTDTELGIDDLLGMSERLAKTSFSIEELEVIYTREIAPAMAGFIATAMFVPMALPDGYGFEELTTIVRTHQSHSWVRRKLNPIRRWLERIARNFARRDWDRVKIKVWTIRHHQANRSSQNFENTEPQPARSVK